MISQELVDWIKSQQAQGYSPQQIYGILVQQGYTPGDAGNAVMSVVGHVQQPAVRQPRPVQPLQPQPVQPAEKSPKPLIVAVLLLLVIIGGAVLYFILFYEGTPADTNATENMTADGGEVVSGSDAGMAAGTWEGEAAGELNASGAAGTEECGEYPDKLEACEPYTCEFTHILTGDLLTREIVGLEGGACHYTEQMPNGGQMECRYSESMRVAAAQSYRDWAAGTEIGIGLQANLTPDGAETSTTYTVDGKEVENPLEEALANGQCVITGYEI